MKYIIKDCALKYNSTLYKIGDEVELDAKTAKEMQHILIAVPNSAGIEDVTGYETPKSKKGKK